MEVVFKSLLDSYTIRERERDSKRLGNQFNFDLRWAGMLRPVPIRFLPKLCQAFSLLEWKPGRKHNFLELKLSSDYPTLHCEFYLFTFFFRAMAKQLPVLSSLTGPIANVLLPQVNSSLSPPITLWNWNCRFASWCKIYLGKSSSGHWFISD